MNNEKLNSLSQKEELPVNSQIERFEHQNIGNNGSPEITETDESALESMAGQPGSGGIEALSPRSDYYDAEDLFQDPIGEIQMDLRTIREETEPLQLSNGNLNSNGNFNGDSRRYKIFVEAKLKSLQAKLK
jgi:hypothetical protein